MKFRAAERGAGGPRGSRRMGKGGQACCHGDQVEDAPGDMGEALGRTALSVVDSAVVVTPGGMRGHTRWWAALQSGSVVSCGQTVGLTRVEVCLAGKGGTDISKGCSCGFQGSVSQAGRKGGKSGVTGGGVEVRSRLKVPMEVRGSQQGDHKGGVLGVREGEVRIYSKCRKTKKRGNLE